MILSFNLKTLNCILKGLTLRGCRKTQFALRQFVLGPCTVS